MAKVMAFGTFDGIHDGHRFFLEKAAAYGKLQVVIARDATVTKVKGRPPLKDENQRLNDLCAEGYDAILGQLNDKYAVIRAYAPDIICLGYDQEAFTDKLGAACLEMGLKTRIMRLPALRPDELKSSLINQHPHGTL